MLKPSKRFILSLSLFALIFLSPSSVSAQGTMECIAGSVFGDPDVTCTSVFGGNNCEDGYTLPCHELTPAICTGVHECVPEESAGGYFIPDPCPDFECPPGDEIFCNVYPPIYTALGCFPTHPVGFIYQLIDVVIGLGGGIAFLMMLIGAFFVLTSQGDPERVKRGKEVFTGGIVGLLFMIFATALLEIIGVEILGLF